MIKIYTAITGNIDAHRADIKCFNAYDNFVHPVMNAKIYKILAHQYVDSDISVWVDGNITLLCSLQELVDEFLGDADIGVFKHPARNCIYEEGEELKKIMKVSQQHSVINEQIEHYKASGYQSNKGLYENGVIVRRHNKVVEEFNNAWWAETCRWSSRDQLSFPVTLVNHPSLKLKANIGDVRNHPMFMYVNH